MTRLVAIRPERPLAGVAVLALAAAFLTPHAAAAQRVRSITGAADTAKAVAKREFGTIDGIVTDSALTPLAAAQVIVLSTAVRVGTGPNGRFRIERVPAGDYVLIVRRAGYAPASQLVQVVASDTLRVAYALERGATTLAPVVVSEERHSVRLAEFDKRRRFGQGEFMTAEDIEKRNSVYATELIRRFPSVNVSPSYGKGAMAEWFAISKREGANPSLGACPMAVYVDYVPMPTPFNLDLLPSPRNIAGIEVYNGPSTIPPQFAGFNRGCGVILIWTKDGY
jgi:hypothetical protein